MPPKPNYQRMLTLIDEVFATRTDPDQIQVTQQQIKILEKIHPNCLSEVSDENGPLIWLLVIPTTAELMNHFLKNQLTERELLERTPIAVHHNAIYLCSVTTLPEASGKGKTFQLCMQTIHEIMQTHPIQYLFVWPFTKAGEALAKKIAHASHLKLLIK
jgi:hypothetical protein